LVSIEIVRCTVCNFGITVSVTEQELGQTECLSLYRICGVPSVFWGLLLVQKCNRERCLTLVTKAIVRSAAYIVGITVSATEKEVEKSECWSL